MQRGKCTHLVTRLPITAERARRRVVIDELHQFHFCGLERLRGSKDGSGRQRLGSPSRKAALYIRCVPETAGCKQSQAKPCRRRVGAGRCGRLSILAPWKTSVIDFNAASVVCGIRDVVRERSGLPGNRISTRIEWYVRRRPAQVLCPSLCRVGIKWCRQQQTGRDREGMR